MRSVVFCGPSISHDEAAAVFPAEILPPVGKGDIDLLLARPRPPERIGIVDGRFLSALSISPKEVLRAMDAGVAVYGSSSMGALRAVECAPLGMIGIGRVFDEYFHGRTDHDDEVAMTFDPETLRPLSEPLITIRLAVGDAVRAGVVSSAFADRFLGVGKQIYFPHRSVAAIIHQMRAEEHGPELERLVAYLRHEAADAKHDDAVLLLRRMRADADNTESARTPIGGAA